VTTSRRVRWAGHEEDEKFIKILVRNSERKGRLVGRRHRCEDNIRMKLKGMKCECEVAD
jgi:hypothetical protein